MGNVELPMIYAGEDRAHAPCQGGGRAAPCRPRRTLHHRPTQLSGGQQQRVAIARALVNTPKMLLADEPTGALDSRTSVELMALFQELNREGATIVIVTHEPDVARYANAADPLPDGRVLSDARQTPADAARRA